MKKTLILFNLLLPLFVLAHTKVDSVPYDGIPPGIKVLFQKPDSTFKRLKQGTGYFNSRVHATITGSLFPGNYRDAAVELEQIRSTKMTKFLDTIYHRIGTSKGFSLLRESISPDSNSHEIFILITTIIPNNDHSTFMVVGIYPKSFDDNLREKFIRSALSIQAH